MNDPMLLVTCHEQDLAWVPELHKAGFSIYVYSKTSESNVDDLWDFVLRTKPKLLLIDDEYNEHIVDFALKVYQSELTQNIWIFFIGKKIICNATLWRKATAGPWKISLAYPPLWNWTNAWWRDRDSLCHKVLDGTTTLKGQWAYSGYKRFTLPRPLTPTWIALYRLQAKSSAPNRKHCFFNLYCLWRR